MIDEKSRRLTDAEVREVLERATQLAAGPDGALTVDELHNIAREVGIPSDALSEALRTVSTSAASERFSDSALGQRDVASIPEAVSDADLARFLRILDRLGLVRGDLSHDGRAVRWRSAEGHLVEVRRHPSDTQVKVDAQLVPSVREIAGCVAGTSFMTAWAFLLEPDLRAAVGGGVVGFMFSVAYLKYRVNRLRESATAAVRGVADALGLIVGGTDRH